MATALGRGPSRGQPASGPQPREDGGTRSSPPPAVPPAGGWRCVKEEMWRPQRRQQTRLAAVGGRGKAEPCPGRPWQWSGRHALTELAEAGRPGWALHEEGQPGGVPALGSPQGGAWARTAEHTHPTPTRSWRPSRTAEQARTPGWDSGSSQPS